MPIIPELEEVGLGIQGHHWIPLSQLSIERSQVTYLITIGKQMILSIVHASVTAIPPSKGVQDDQDGTASLNWSRMSPAVLVASESKSAFLVALNSRIH